MENERETLRYLGYHGQEAERDIRRLIGECWEELEQAATPRHMVREFPLKLENGLIEISVLTVISRNLERNLKDCEKVLLFGATLGSQVDVLLRRYNKIRISKAVVMQAAATAMLEDYCDRVNRQLKQEYLDQGYYLRPRFSPGYGDFPLETQKELFAVMELGKRIGITLTDSLLMMPSKSVTAVIGISQKPVDCTVHGCESCQKADCLYRRSHPSDTP